MKTGDNREIPPYIEIGARVRVYRPQKQIHASGRITSVGEGMVFVALDGHNGTHPFFWNECEPAE